MAWLFRLKKTEIVDGERVDVLDGKGQPVYLPYWRARITLHDGTKQKVVLPTESRKEAERLVAQMEARQMNIRNGIIQLPVKNANADGQRSVSVPS